MRYICDNCKQFLVEYSDDGYYRFPTRVKALLMNCNEIKIKCSRCGKEKIIKIKVKK